ncbi:MAG: TetR/AcrR family transcriptional regulator [Actinomycetes bacterium]
MARAAFATDGYAAASTTQIADRAKVSRGALYHHFEDKAALFEAVFAELCAEYDGTVTQAGAEGRNAREAVLLAARAGLEFSCRADYRQIAVTDGPAVLGLDRWHQIDGAHGISSMRLGLELLAAEGELGVTVTDALVRAVFGALTELAMACGKGDLTVDESVEAFETLLDQLSLRVPARRAAARR